MTDSDIIKKATSRAVKNGFSPGVMEVNIKHLEDNLIELGVYKMIVRGIFLSHEFAKAFWSDKVIEVPGVEKVLSTTGCVKVVDKIRLPVYQYHLQQMVIEQEPLKYLERILTLDV